VRNRRTQRIALAAIILVAAVLRIYALADVPAGLYCDEAGNGYNAYALGTAGIDENGTRWPLYVWSFATAYKNPAFIYAAILPVKLLGLSEFSVRLTAALFGIGTVAAMFFLGRAMFGPWVGFWAALFLALSPWHLHFSRIAFELIVFPFLFVTGTVFLVRFTQGRRTLPAALACYGACVYAYAPAALFVPLSLLGFVLLYVPELLRHWRQLLLSLVVAAAVLAPAAVFFNTQRTSGTVYFRRTTFLEPEQPWRPQFDRFALNYQQFFSPRFLIQEGDPIFRHSVRGFGELYPFMIPFVVIGAGTALLRRDRASKLVLWWLVLYPVAPSLMNEIPSATRGIIGAPVFSLLAGIGFAAALRVLRWLVNPAFRRLRGDRRRWRLAVQGAAVAAGALLLGTQAARYLYAYFVDYPTYAALTPGGFQYGYRDVIQYMESQRGNYDVLLLSATDSNQPQVFAQFYRPIDPRDWVSRRDAGYLIIKPEEFSRYSAKQRVLAALHPNDVDLFSDLDIKRRVEGPGGKLAFVVAEVKGRKEYLKNWQVLGLFLNDDLRGPTRDFIDPTDLTPTKYRGAFGDVTWVALYQPFVHVDLNRGFANADPRTPGNPEHVCAYAATTIRSPTAREAVLELSGSLNDTLRAWLNGRLLTPFPLTMAGHPKYRPIELRAGDNGLVVQSCEDIGDWQFDARITDAQGRDLPDITTVSKLPVEAMRPAAAVASVTDGASATGDGAGSAPYQVIEGFAAALGGDRDPNYPDHRGGSESWRARVSDHSAVTWRTAPPAAAENTIFAFTGSTSDEEGDFALSVDGLYALTFQSQRDREVRSWSENGYTLVFVSRASIAGNSGFYLLSVPAARITPGRPLELRVAGADGDPAAWFMIKAYRDTLAQEKVTPALAIEATRGAWRTRRLAVAVPQ
jgi:4-amino-4-deoxy-L-arabinose transferase-like glycosyltransferase